MPVVTKSKLIEATVNYMKALDEYRAIAERGTPIITSDFKNSKLWRMFERAEEAHSEYRRLHHAYISQTGRKGMQPDE